jgi:hypothetical protein
MEVDESRIKMVIVLITDLFNEEGISQLEGAVAMRAILATLADQGLDVQSELAMQS